jgi:hypothetical protein
MNKVTRLELCNCFAARQASRHLTKLYERHLADAEVTSAQFSKKALALWSNAQQKFESTIGSGEAARLRRGLLALARPT